MRTAGVEQPFLFFAVAINNNGIKSKMTSTASAWDNDYAQLARISSQLNVKGQEPSTRSHRISTFRDGLENLNRKLLEMEQASKQASSFGSNVNQRLYLTPDECARRRTLLEGLGKKYDSLVSGDGNDPFTTSAQPTYSTFGSDHSIGGTGIKQRTSALVQQDAMLDELAAGVGKLKDTSRIIGEEAKHHVNLLNDMERDMEGARGGLAEETNNALKLKEDQSVWRLHLVICGLSTLMFFLILCGIS